MTNYNFQKLSPIFDKFFANKFKAVNKIDSTGHPIYEIILPSSFDKLSFNIKEFILQLDEIQWQIVTKKNYPYYNHSDYNVITIAPIILFEEKFERVYHVTKSQSELSILNQGILKSSENIKISGFPDTYGKIYFCRSIKNTDTSNGVSFWISEFSLHSPGNYIVFEVDISMLESCARIYRDTHSIDGIVVDRVDCVKPIHILRKLNPIEYE